MYTKSIYGDSTISKKKEIEKYEEQKYKGKVNEDDPRYYKIKANFKYLDNYNMKITK